MGDEALIQKYRETGDCGAMDALLERHRGMVKRKARCYYLAGGSQDDLIQEGMIGLFKAVRDYDAARGVSFKAFAQMCVLRQLATALKCSTREKHMPLNRYVSFYHSISEGGETEIKDILEDEGLSPEQIVIGREDFDDLERRINSRLSDLEKKVLRLFLSGKRYAELAEELGISVKSIDNALQRIRKKLSENG